LALSPDRGASTSDGITWLADGEQLMIAAKLDAVPVTVALYCQPHGGEHTLLSTTEISDADGLQLLLPVDLPGEGTGNFTLSLTTQDSAGNISAAATMAIVIDDVPLSVDFSQLPGSFAAADALIITFNAVLARDLMLTDLTLDYAGQAVPAEALTLSKTAPTEYTLSGLLAIPREDNGDFTLAVNLADLAKALSGLPGQGRYEQSWAFTLDNLNASLAWQAGWNAVVLPFEFLTAASWVALQAMPCFVYAPDGKSFVLAEPQLGLPCWIFLENLVAEPILQGKLSNATGITPVSNPTGWNFCGALGDNIPAGTMTAWGWQEGVFRPIDILRQGNAYMLLP